MNKIIKQEIGKLKIYLKQSETVKREKLLHVLFPKNTYSKVLEEAKRANIRNAHIYRTHATYEQGGNIVHHHVETGDAGLVVCLELVAEKEKLEAFVTAHKELLKNKTIIYKPVELWTFTE